MTQPSETPILDRNVPDRTSNGKGGLTIEGLVAGYGGGIVIDGLSLSVEAGEIVSLLGRNGVGKTTLLRTIMGLIRPNAGMIHFEDMRIDGREPFEVARAGIGFVPQGREIFTDLTVDENLILGNLKAANADEIYALFPALAQRRNHTSGRLSGGLQQQLAIGRALMGRPKLLLLDEPSEGIQPSVVDDILMTLRSIVRERQMSLILVEQNVDITLALSDRIDFIDQGRVVASETAAALKADATLIDRHMTL
jgi:urea ABC transporter ATP-binding protein UrtE